MINKKEIIEKFNNIEDKTLLARILDKAIQAEKSRSITNTDFLDPYQQKLALKALNGPKGMNCLGEVEYCFNGGFEEAERKIITFSGKYDLGNEWENPIKILNIELRADANLSHRDYLGSIMGLGIKREKIGDIIVKENSATVIVLKDIAEYILYNLQKIGRISTNVEYGSPEDISSTELSKFKEIKCTVPSLRLDCIVSHGFGLSRSKTVPLFSANRVFLNWEPESKLSAQIKEGDVISIKGKGRIILSEIGNVTRKGRIAVVIKKLI